MNFSLERRKLSGCYSKPLVMKRTFGGKNQGLSGILKVTKTRSFFIELPKLKVLPSKSLSLSMVIRFLPILLILKFTY